MQGGKKPIIPSVGEQTGPFSAHSSPTDTHRKPPISAGAWTQRGYPAPVQQRKTPRVPFTEQAGVMVLACCAGALEMTRSFSTVFLRSLYFPPLTVTCTYLSKLNTVGLVLLIKITPPLVPARRHLPQS